MSRLLCFILFAYAGVAAELQITPAHRAHWAYQPLTNPPLPRVKDTAWVRTPIDQFILAALEAKSLRPNPEASPQVLARRISYDLIGLPPGNSALQSRDREGAFPEFSLALIDQLLERPHYGERWGRHWLDVARYADSDGQESDADRPAAHQYRDFVIRALNENLPFDTFVRWQLAGDELEPDNSQAIAATGFIVACPNTVLNVAMEDEKIFNRFNELDDQVSTTGSALLGLTLACARCHDHKYDAIPTRDYYRMLKAFNGGDRDLVPLAPLEQALKYRAAQTNWNADFNAASNRFEKFVAKAVKSHESEARQAKIKALEITDAEKAALINEPDSKTAKDLAKKFAKELRVERKDCRPFLSEDDRAEWDRLQKEVKDIEARRPKTLPTALAFADYGPEPRETWLFSRGDFHSKKEQLELGFVSVLLRDKTPEDYWKAARDQKRRNDSTQQRRAMAEWMTDTNHGAGALVARVIVNRIWQHHFGEGLVRTVNDFGVRGEKPTHPELLEWLTSEFVRGGWKLKPLHKLIMTSAVYLQDSKFDAVKAKIDPDNRLLWRHRPQRLESEILRDAMLAVSGKLNLQMFGPAFKAPIASEAIQARNMTDPYPKDLKDTPNTWRRSVYMFHKRVVQYPLMQAFDGPTAQTSCGRRDVTTVAPQGLALLNDRFVRLRAEDFARRLKKEAGNDVKSQVRLAWQLAFTRDPLPNELEASASFIEAQAQRRSSSIKSTDLALTDFCQMIFAMNEFVYVD
ncbi:MAG TPA: DUF1549 and DUF1553 domain-containing protein [Verrucomicrobiae bacterium]|nr:DUF1549 and DUF1553 domain-containing protein [Verrucomicrobiae bacterium]